MTDDGDAEIRVSDPVAYEQAALEVIRSRLEQMRPAAEGYGRTLVRAESEGQYPETRLKVTWLETSTENEREIEIRLWDPELAGPGGGRWHPEVLADIFVRDLEEPGEI